MIAIRACRSLHISASGLIERCLTAESPRQGKLTTKTMTTDLIHNRRLTWARW